jgi:uncharacterized Fe-S center protein
MDLPGYDSWKLAAPAEDVYYVKWLEGLSLDEVMEICGEAVIKILWEDGNELILNRLANYYTNEVVGRR